MAVKVLSVRADELSWWGFAVSFHSFSHLERVLSCFSELWSRKLCLGSRVAELWGLPPVPCAPCYEKAGPSWVAFNKVLNPIHEGLATASTQSSPNGLMLGVGGLDTGIWGGDTGDPEGAPSFTEPGRPPPVPFPLPAVS